MVKIIEDHGSDSNHAIKILEAKDHFDGIRAEYAYLMKKFGIMDVDWNLVIQMTTKENNKQFDVFLIALKDKSVLSLYFDVTDFFGKY